MIFLKNKNAAFLEKLRFYLQENEEKSVISVTILIHCVILEQQKKATFVLLSFHYRQWPKNEIEQGLAKRWKDAINWEPIVKATKVGVSAKDGMITHTGIVDTYVQKTKAERNIRNGPNIKSIDTKLFVGYDN